MSIFDRDNANNPFNIARDQDDRTRRRLDEDRRRIEGMNPDLAIATRSGSPVGGIPPTFP